MSDKKPTADLAAIIKSLRGYLLEKGHCIERGPSYEGQSKTPASVAEMVRRYEGRGYTKYSSVATSRSDRGTRRPAADHGTSQSNAA